MYGNVVCVLWVERGRVLLSVLPVSYGERRGLRIRLVAMGITVGE